MKHILKLIVGASAMMMATAGAQSVFDRGESVSSGHGEDQRSKPFKMRGPFVLTWDLIDKPASDRSDKDWRKPYNEDNPAWVSIRVLDAGSGKLVESARQTGMTGRLAVAAAGTFVLDVTSLNYVEWVIRGKEGKLRMKANGKEEIVNLSSADRDAANGRTAVVSVPAVSSEPEPTRGPVIRSTWSGKGLPPGMMKK